MIYFYYGENLEGRDAAIQSLVGDFILHNGDMAIDTIQVEDAKMEAVIDSVTTVPFLSSRRLVIMRYTSANKDLAGTIADVLDRVADTTDLLFVEAIVDNRSVYAKTLKKRADTVKHFEAVEGHQFEQLVVARAQEQGSNISLADARYLIDRVGANHQLVMSEVRKLALCGAQISRPLINDMTQLSPRSSVFEMLDSLGQGDIAKALRLYDEQRSQGVEPQVILSMLAWQLHVIAQIVFAGSTAPDAIATSTKLNPFVVRKNLPVARRLSRERLVLLYDAALKADEDIKTGRTKADDQTRTLLVNLSAILNAS